MAELAFLSRIKGLAAQARAAGRPGTLLAAHRGGARVAPENTMAAFEPAVRRWGAALLELDVHLSADGEVVVWHDPTLDRCSDAEGPLADRTWAELARLDAGFHFEADADVAAEVAHGGRGHGARPCRLVEVLRAFPDTLLNIELKPTDPVRAEAFAALLRAEDAVDRVCVGSEHDAVGLALVAALPEACHFYPAQALSACIWAALGGKPLPEAPFTVIDMPARWNGAWLVTPALVKAAADAGRWINVWTIDEADDMARLIDLGVGGIMTDRPDRLRAELG